MWMPSIELSSRRSMTPQRRPPWEPGPAKRWRPRFRGSATRKQSGRSFRRPRTEERDQSEVPRRPESAAMTSRTFLRRSLDRARRRASTELDWLGSRRARADLAVFHEFHAPPYGGGNQFLLALVQELRRRGLSVELNRLSGGTPASLYNSFNFDFRRLQRFARDGVRMVHRVDGPIGAYRGFDDGTDTRIIEINQELAATTIVQSEYSLEKHRELGLELRDPVVIHNSVDPEIFHPPAERDPLSGRRLRVIATSWSDNPRKGADVLQWLDRNLDVDSDELTFAGRTQAKLERVRVIEPLPSVQLA